MSKKLENKCKQVVIIGGLEDFYLLVKNVKNQICDVESNPLNFYSSLSPDGNTLASGSYDNSIRLWDVKKGQQKAKLDAHSNESLSVCLSHDTKYPSFQWQNNHSFDQRYKEKKVQLESISFFITTMNHEMLKMGLIIPIQVCLKRQFYLLERLQTLKSKRLKKFIKVLYFKIF
ncbi:unnamed protein product [Paramecium pentaurelia]|uniref:Uncharacterized protein n=1 Tax=Paramecium pentaurelia TaxID=43138 RepID=A0A8S1VHV4_9CILI|nr:unnamed protein product [Paramecium pentaurelia]